CSGCRRLESQPAAGLGTRRDHLYPTASPVHPQACSGAGIRHGRFSRHPAPAPRRADAAMSVRRISSVLPAVSLLSLAVCGTLHAQVPATQNDWGGIGLLQTPTARMAEEGEFAFTASHTTPYTRYNVLMQPFPW